MNRTPLPRPTPEWRPGYTAEAMRRGAPVARKTHDGKYGETPPLRQRGGGGWQSCQPPPYPLSEERKLPLQGSLGRNLRVKIQIATKSTAR
ncbi:hypothetical protein Q31a_50280 [Aureliella helgolandensis]|uniref:Uncharacterized protein n=1 Tax=Aureliella helgolandensis TaxID=2527968 RepID=A0A518GDH6_9BACT|nr:hypothetical protein Q31a_50280 [Aureliella helgolandensis]